MLSRAINNLVYSLIAISVYSQGFQGSEQRIKVNMLSEKWKLYNKLWRKTDRGKFHRKKEKYNYILSFDEYQNLIEKQNNLCAICLMPEKDKALAIDHCHKTFKIRGLLCQKCNRGLGCFNDESFLVQNAYNYLVKN